MINYAVCEVAGKQYKVIPGHAFEVDFLGEPKENIEVNVLLLSRDDKLQIGTPFLKEKLTLKRVENTRGEKIRVSKFHAKANYRRSTGHKSKLTKLVLEGKNGA